MKPVCIIGAGSSMIKSQGIKMSSDEIILEAIQSALEDTQINLNQLKSIVFCEKKENETFKELSFENTKIENLPALKINEDGIFGILIGLIQIISEIHDPVMIVGYGNPADRTNKPSPETPLDSLHMESLNNHPLFIAGVEMDRYLQISKTTQNTCAEVVVKSKENAAKNPRANFGSKLAVEQVLNSEMLISPLSTMDVSPWINGACAVILSSGEVAKKLCPNPIWISGFAWGTDAGTCLWTDEEIGWPAYLERLALKAFSRADIKNPLDEINILEVEDTYSYQVLQSLETMGFSEKGKGIKLFEYSFPVVNPSGGCLGMGNSSSAKGLIKVTEAILQLKNLAGENQVEKHLEVALIQSSSALPNRSGGILILKKTLV